MKLTSIKNQTKKFKINFGDEGDLNVEYFPAKFTVGFQKQLMKLANEEETSDDTEKGDFFELLMTIICKWDLLDDEGVAYPINKETIAELPLSLVLEISRCISDGVNPTPKTPTKSSSFV